MDRQADRRRFLGRRTLPFVVFCAPIAGALIAALALLLLRTDDRLDAETAAPPTPAPAIRSPSSGGEELGPGEPLPRARRGAPEQGQGGLGSVTLHAVLDLPCEPIQPFEVTLAPVTPGAKEAGAGEESSGRRTSKTFAEAIWTALAPGRYRVEARADRWKTAEVHVELGQGGARVYLEPQPLHQLAGIVVAAESGEPLETVQVRIEVAAHENGGIRESWTAREVSLHAPDGRFAFAGVPRRARELRAVFGSPGRLSYATEWLSADAWEDGLRIELERIADGEAIVVGRVASAVERTPLPGAEVLLVRPDATVARARTFDGHVLVEDALLADEASEPPTGRDRAGDDGTFRLHSRFEGEARLLVFHPAHRLRLTDPFLLRRGRPFAVGSVLLEPGGAIEGRVWTAHEPTGSEARPESVLVTDENGQQRWVALGAEGDFRVGGLSPGTYRIAAHAPLPASDGSVSLMPVATASVDLAAFETVTVDLHYGSGLSGTTLRGRMELPEPALAEGRVQLHDLDLSPVRMAFASESGSFALPDVPAGSHTLIAAARDPRETRFALTRMPLEVPPPAGDLLRISFARSRLTVRCVDRAEKPVRVRSRTESPLFDELVAAALRGNFDDSGLFVLWGLPAGTYDLESGPFRARLQLAADAGSWTCELERER